MCLHVTSTTPPAKDRVVYKVLEIDGIGELRSPFNYHQWEDGKEYVAEFRDRIREDGSDGEGGFHVFLNKEDVQWCVERAEQLFGSSGEEYVVRRFLAKASDFLASGSWPDTEYSTAKNNRIVACATYRKLTMLPEGATERK